jgi:hypothetical protein
MSTYYSMKECVSHVKCQGANSSKLPKLSQSTIPFEFLERHADKVFVGNENVERLVADPVANRSLLEQLSVDEMYATRVGFTDTF